MSDIPILGADKPREVPIMDVKALVDAKEGIVAHQMAANEAAGTGLELARALSAVLDEPDEGRRDLHGSRVVRALVAAALAARGEMQAATESSRRVQRVVASTGVHFKDVANVDFDRGVVQLHPKQTTPPEAISLRVN